MPLRRIPRRLLAMAALAVGLVIATPAAALALPTPPAPPGWSEVINPTAGMPDGFPVCLDVENGSVSSGARIGMWHCHGYASNGNPQRWVFLRTQPNDNVYEIYNVGSGKCLTPRPFSRDPIAGDPISQEPCGKYVTQEWRMVDSPPTDFLLQNYRFPSLCLGTYSGPESRNGTSPGLLLCGVSYANFTEIWGLA